MSSIRELDGIFWPLPSEAKDRFYKRGSSLYLKSAQDIGKAFAITLRDK